MLKRRVLLAIRLLIIWKGELIDYLINSFLYWSIYINGLKERLKFVSIKILCLIIIIISLNYSCQSVYLVLKKNCEGREENQELE